MDERLKVVYDEAVRAITQQAGSLDELRARAGMLFSAASFAAGFLGGAQFVTHKHLSPDVWVGIVGFAVASISAALILMPRGLFLKRLLTPWVFSNSPNALLAKYVDGEPKSYDIDGMYRQAASDFDVEFGKNQKSLDLLGWLVVAACAGVIVEVIGFLINL